MNHSQWLDKFEKKHSPKRRTLFDPITTAQSSWPADLARQGWQLRCSDVGRFSAYRSWFDGEEYRDHSTAMYDSVGELVERLSISNGG